MKIEITEKKVIDVTPRVLAVAFWEMEAEQQAEFFGHLFDIADKEDFEQQILYCAYNASEGAKKVMVEIGKAAS